MFEVSVGVAYAQALASLYQCVGLNLYFVQIILTRNNVLCLSCSTVKKGLKILSY